MVMLGRDCWRGKVRQKWSESGLECAVFELLARMLGGPTRTKLQGILMEPRSKLQLANEAGPIDWKAVDRHICRMIDCGLVQGATVAGTCTVYVTTEKGKRALAVLKD